MLIHSIYFDRNVSVKRSAKESESVSVNESEKESGNESARENENENECKCENRIIYWGIGHRLIYTIVRISVVTLS